ncbi:MAG: PHP domain-containing protein [Gemmatimonadetes bacterium]|nr:PHP domain-containing protein [Gemmatimonadota bacterium]
MFPPPTTPTHPLVRRLPALALLIVLATAALAFAGPHVDRAQADPRWYKGNTHTHTINSDGDSHPDDVVKWYKERGYAFLVLTDHNVLTSVEALNALHGLDQRFLVIRGEEVTDRFGEAPIHMNALGPSRLVEPQGGTSVVDVMRRNARAIRAAEAVPHLNHPNFGWAVSADELRQVAELSLFEVFNGHPMVNNLGGGGVAGLEEAWDQILSSGKLLYGLATDDAHHFKRPEDPTAARPGQGWIVVRADTLTPAAILAAIERGEFYASTGVELRDYRVTPSEITLDIRTTAFSKYRVRFTGKDGKLLGEVTTNPATYRIAGGEGYVRATVLESNGAKAWTQPVLVGAPR